MPDITLTISTANATRLSIAVQEQDELPAPATAPEVKSFIVRHLKGVVNQSERRLAQQALPPPDDFPVT